MARCIVVVPEDGRLFMSVPSFRHWILKQLKGCSDRFVSLKIESPSDLPNGISNYVTLSFHAVVEDVKLLSLETKNKLTGRKRAAYAPDKKHSLIRDIRISTKLKGNILTKAEVLAAFGYSPRTYVGDTTVLQHQLVVYVGKGRYKVVGPGDHS